MRSFLARILVVIVIGAAVAVAAQPTAAAPKAELWPKWQAHDPDAEDRPSHGAWDRFLATYVAIGSDGVARVSYGKVSPGDRKSLDAYIATLSNRRVSALSRPAQMALWINLYNALTVAVVLDHYLVDTILDIDISPGLFANGPWGKKLVAVEGEQLSLNDIEHRILRPIWRDARIHYVVNCASLGCPNLASRAYTQDRLEEMLNAAARDFVNSPRGIDFDGDQTIGSKLYDWYREDFGQSDREVLEHLISFADPDLKERLTSIKKIDRHSYNWQLNDASILPKFKMDMEEQRESR